MGRPDKPVDRTIPARARLAEFLRARRSSADVTYEQMAKDANGLPSAATLKRAACGESVPTWETVVCYLMTTISDQEIFAGDTLVAVNEARELWIRARRATRAPYHVHKAPDPDLISNKADLSRALRDLHAWVGAPSPREMEAFVDVGELPHSTARRIIKGQILPVDIRQTGAFLRACLVSPLDVERWIRAVRRCESPAREEIARLDYGRSRRAVLKLKDAGLLDFGRKEAA